jgi:hypothetical protein
MMDEPRRHDPNPTEEERAWMATDPFPIVYRVAALAGVALLLGFAATLG